MLANVAQTRIALAPYVKNGVCPDDPAVLQYINEACDRLIDSGKWKGLIAKIHMCHRAGVITLPRDVETVLQSSDCGAPVTINNEWFEYLPGGPWQLDQCNAWPVMVDRGDNWPTTFDITGNMLIRVYNDLSVDNGKTLLFQGTDENDNRVQTLVDGEWVDGEVFIFNNATPPVSTVTWKQIESAQKELTTGYIRVYQVDPNTMENAGLLAIYHPNDEFPAFRRLYYANFCVTRCSDETPTQRYHPLTFLVKKRHVPLVRETDMVPITASGALKNMCMALWLERNNQRDLADQYEAKAVSCLQNELKQSQGAQVRMKSQIVGFGNYAPARSFR